MPVVTITQPPTHKCGSTWTFVLTRKQPDGTAVDLTGLTIRAVCRVGAVDGEVLAELTDSTGITRDDLAGRIVMKIDATTSATAPPNRWIYFEAEMVAADGDVWQSPTYRFKTEAQVT
jgi:hypothetical protein